MRLPQPKRFTGRVPQDEKRVPVKVMRPLKLREYVSGRGDHNPSKPCIQEMTVMMACFKTNNFEQAPCEQEIARFQNCVIENKKQWEEKQEMMKKGISIGTKNLDHQQLNLILKKYPKS